MVSTTVEARFGETVRLIRQRRGLTQSSAAKKAGVSASYWALIEQGKRAPGLEIVERISGALDIPATVLFFLSGDMGEMEKLDRDIAERLALLSWKLIGSAEPSEG